MKLSGPTIRNRARVLLTLESNRDSLVESDRPEEVEIIAWAEGRLTDDAANKIKHWVVNDESCYDIYAEHLEHADIEPSTEPVINPTKIPRLPSKQRLESPGKPSTFAVLWQKLNSSIGRFFSGTGTGAAVAFASVAAIATLVFILFPRDETLNLLDYANMTSNPSENWRYQAAIDPSSRAATEENSRNDKTAYLFGVRSSLQELGINETPEVKTYFDSLPFDYPICMQKVELCEQTNHWHFGLGQWSVLTERACNGKLTARDQKALLDSQGKLLSALLKNMKKNPVEIDDQLSTLLIDDDISNLCQVQDAAHKWAAS